MTMQIRNCAVCLSAARVLPGTLAADLS